MFDGEVMTWRSTNLTRVNLWRDGLLVLQLALAALLTLEHPTDRKYHFHGKYWVTEEQRVSAALTRSRHCLTVVLGLELQEVAVVPFVFGKIRWC